jgi:hypothetical protein
MLSVTRQKLPASGPPVHSNSENHQAHRIPDPEDRQSFRFIELPSARGEASGLLEPADRPDACPVTSTPEASGSSARQSSNLKTYQSQIRVSQTSPYLLRSHKMVHIKLTQPSRPSQETESPETPTTHLKKQSLRRGFTADRSALSSHFPLFTISGSFYGEVQRSTVSHNQQSDRRQDNGSFGIDTNVDYFKIYMQDQDLARFCSKTKPDSHYCDMVLHIKNPVAPPTRHALVYRSDLRDSSCSFSSQ